jgi:hypothetical protein
MLCGRRECVASADDFERTLEGKGETMQKVMKISRISVAVAIVGLVLLLSFRGAAQEKASMREVYQAQAMGQGTQLGQTFNVTIVIDQYSTPEDRQILVGAFKDAGSQGLSNALFKMHADGRIAITGTLGYDISFARKIKTADGYLVRVLTNRPIAFGEAWSQSRSMNYDLSLMELNINDDAKKSTGILLPACQIAIDKKTGEVTAEAFRNPWKLVDIQNRSKE